MKDLESLREENKQLNDELERLRLTRLNAHLREKLRHERMYPPAYPTGGMPYFPHRPSNRTTAWIVN